VSHRSIVVLAAATVAAALSAAAPASAASYSCQSSAVRGQVLTAPPIEPVTANAGQTACSTQKNGLGTALPSLLNIQTLFAETALTGPETAVAEQAATASGGIADLRIGPATDLGVQLPIDQALAPIGPVTVPGVGTLDLRRAILATLQPSPEVLRVQIAAAYAKAQCAGGELELSGSSNIAGVRLLGLELPTDRVVTQTATAIGGGTIDPSSLALGELLPGVSITPLTQVAVQPVLDALPNITIPATLAEISITPNAQEKTATRLTQRALALNLKVAGQQVLDLALGEATVGASDVDCSAAGAASPSQAALQCTTRRLVLTDVYERRGRVRLEGAADRRFIGRTVDIHYVRPFGGGPRVARAKVAKDGSFRTTAKLPPRRVRGSNNTRYQARLGKERSLRLKLRRRMVVRSVRVSGGKVRISGVVTRPLASPVRTIEVRRRVSCKRWVLVKRIRPRSSGAWSTTVDAPPSQLAAAYRFATKVRKFRRNPKTYPTFTLPRYVDLT
jgi:hypothetical protein